MKNAAYNRTGLWFRSDPKERLFGHGAQFTHFDLKGRLVPIRVREQGTGRGAQPLTAIVNLVARAGGRWHTTDAPIPYSMTSRLRSLAPENSDYTTFDFRQRDAVAIEVWLPNLGEQRKV